MSAKAMIITGASRGIGAATALLGAQRGYAACVNYLQARDAAEGVVERILAGGGRAFAVQADVSRENEVSRLFRTVDEVLGPVTALVNNAGVLEGQARVEEMDATRVNRVLTTNVTSCFLCCREAVLRMSTRHGGDGGASSTYPPPLHVSAPPASTSTTRHPKAPSIRSRSASRVRSRPRGSG